MNIQVRCQILDELHDLLYSQKDCICGGPLHIVLDNCNMKDGDLQSCIEHYNKEKYGDVKELCYAIIDMLKTFSFVQRVLWYHHESIDKIIAAKDQVFGPTG